MLKAQLGFFLHKCVRFQLNHHSAFHKVFLIFLKVNKIKLNLKN